MTKQQQHLFLAPQNDLEKLSATIDNLGTVNESPDYWANIINNTQLDLFQRRLSEALFFQRHLKINNSINDLAALIHKLKSIREQEITLLKGPGGPIPIKYDPADSIILVMFLPTKDHQDSGM